MIYYDKEHECRYLSTILNDSVIFKRVAKNRKFLGKHLFNVRGHQFIAQIIDAMTRKYNSPLPLQDAIRIIRLKVEQFYSDPSIREDYFTLLEGVIGTEPDPTAFDFLYNSLTECSRARQLKETLSKITEKLEKDKLDEAIDIVRGFKLSDVSSTFVKTKDVVGDYLEYRGLVMDKLNNPDKYRGIKTGFKLLDENISSMGTFKGKFYLCLGFTKRGKSFFLMEVGYKAALQGMKVVHATIENTAVDALSRFYARASGVPTDYLKSPNILTFDERGGKTFQPLLSDEDMTKLDDTVTKFRNNNIVYKVLSFNHGVSVSDIEAELKNLPFNPDVLIIDHLPDMKPSPSFTGSSKSWDAIGDVSWEMSQLARNWNDQEGLIVWTAAQVRSECEFDDHLTNQSIAYSRVPITHANTTVYLTATKDDLRHNVRRFGVINSRDMDTDEKQEILLTNLGVAKLHDKEREKDTVLQQYLMRIKRDSLRGSN